MTKAGFISFVGRPNAGKSSLMNAIVGQKIAITSNRPQTTRKAIRGIRNTDSGQLIIVDTPGLHKPRTLLGERLNDLVESELSDMDVIGFCSPANEDLGPGDKRIIEQLAGYKKPKKIAILTKTDLVGPERIAKRLIELSEVFEWDEIVPVSSKTSAQVDLLSDLATAMMPDSERLYPDEIITELSEGERACEEVRESALGFLENELPHSLAVTMDEWENEDMHISIHVERDSQKGIIIGNKGERLSKIRQRSQRNIRKILGRPIKLSLHVKVSKDWQQDPKLLGRLGF
jgi:GTP-binding protein Era